jgi:tetratricopeptide (TPR) repeat protein
VGARALAAAERALAINPSSALGHAAMATYHMVVSGSPAKASDHVERALALEPNNPVILARASGVEQAIGQWDQALVNIQRAQRLDPRSVSVHNRLQNALLWLRRYPEALNASEAALALAPGDLSISQDKSMVFVAQGDLNGAREVIRQISPAVAPEELAAFFGNYWDMYWVLPDSLQRVLVTLRPSHFDEDRSSWANVMMQTWWHLGERAKARAYADTAVAFNDEVLAALPDNAQRLAFKGLALAYLGRKPEAIALADRVLQVRPMEQDYTNGTYFAHVVARVYHLAGENDKALDLLERLLQVPYFLSAGWLRIDPTFAELKGNPRFDRLIAAQ